MLDVDTETFPSSISSWGRKHQILVPFKEKRGKSNTAFCIGCDAVVPAIDFTYDALISEKSSTLYQRKISSPTSLKLAPTAPSWHLVSYIPMFHSPISSVHFWRSPLELIAHMSQNGLKPCVILQFRVVVGELVKLSQLALCWLQASTALWNLSASLPSHKASPLVLSESQACPQCQVDVFLTFQGQDYRLWLYSSMMRRQDFHRINNHLGKR